MVVPGVITTMFLFLTSLKCLCLQTFLISDNKSQAKTAFCNPRNQSLTILICSFVEGALAQGCLFDLLCFRLCKLCWDIKLISCLGHMGYY